MKNRGQMYIVAALIIIAFVISVGTVYNYAKTSKEDNRIVDLSKEIDFETSKIIDWGTYKVSDVEGPINIESRVEEISQYYASLDPRSELITVLGDPNQPNQIITSYYKLDSEGTVCIQSGSGCSSIEMFRKVRTSAPFSLDSNNILTVDLGGGKNYNFKMNQGENFFIILVSNIEDEVFVSGPEIV